MITAALALYLTIAITTQEPSHTVRIALDSDSASEAATREQLERLLERLEPERWIFSPDVLIKDRTIPRSHPVVTMRTGESDRELIANFLHENIHWYLSERRPALERAIVELRLRYPSLPVAFPEGAGDEYSSYLHLVVCALEFKALREVVGDVEAVGTMQYWATHHYTKIYSIVIEDEAAIMALLDEHDLSNRAQGE